MNTHYHFIGIGGIGMSGLARLLKEKECTVTGSDKVESQIIRDLQKMGVVFSLGHKPENVPEGAKIIFSSMIGNENPELAQASKMKCHVLHRSDLLLDLMKDSLSLIVTGTHGKTTTSSLLSHTLISAGLQPSWAVGGIINNYGTNAGLGKGKYFVAEADESDGTHLKYNPHGLIVTNIDLDHMDFYKTEGRLLESFKAIIYKASSYELLFWCGDDEKLKSLDLPGYSYGFGENCKLRIENVVKNGFKTTFDISFEGKKYSRIAIGLIGDHNVLNSAAVFGLSLNLGVSEDLIRKGLSSFQGAKRRTEIKSMQRERCIIDDYGHHPSEIKATLKAIREAFRDERLIAVFQPHRYTRTKELMQQFHTSLSDADLVILTDIYGAGELPIENVTVENLLSTFKSALYVPRSELTEYLKNLQRPFDVIVTIGAGDITHVSDELKMTPPVKMNAGIVFGGRSREHEISFLSARNVKHWFESDLFELDFYAISKQGTWTKGEEAKKLLNDQPEYRSYGQILTAEVLEALQKLEIIFPCLHGTYGEDGLIQGFFEMLKIPYVSSSVLPSALAMNKAYTKKLALFNGLKTAEFVDFTAYEWSLNREDLLDSAEAIGYPLFVKPVHLGSTIGVKKVFNRQQLCQAIQDALDVDGHILAEKMIEGRELEFSVVGRGPYQVFAPGEICAGGDVYDYEGKYGEHAVQVKVQAELTQEEIRLGKEFALKAYQAINGDGMARVDLFLNTEGEYCLNEINPIPGCTQNSLFPKMCQAGGLLPADLLKLLVKSSLKRSRDDARVH